MKLDVWKKPSMCALVSRVSTKIKVYSNLKVSVTKKSIQLPYTNTGEKITKN